MSDQAPLNMERCKKMIAQFRVMASAIVIIICCACESNIRAEDTEKHHAIEPTNAQYTTFRICHLEYTKKRMWYIANTESVYWYNTDGSALMQSIDIEDKLGRGIVIVTSADINKHGDRWLTGGRGGSQPFLVVNNTGCEKWFRYFDIPPKSRWEGFTYVVHACAFSPDSHFVCGGVGSTLLLWKFPSRDLAHPAVKLEDPILSLSFSPDSEYLAVGLGDPDAVPNQGPATRKTPSVPDQVPFDISCDGTSRVLVFRVKPFSQFFTAENSAYTYFVEFSPDGKLLATLSMNQGVGSEGTTLSVRQITPPRKTILNISSPDVFRTLTFHPFSRAVLVASDNNSIQVYDLNTGDSVELWYRVPESGELEGDLAKVLPRDHRVHRMMNELAISKDGTHLLAGCNDGAVFWFQLNVSESIQCWDQRGK